MPKSWPEVAASASYQALSPEEQSEARDQYFHDVVAPKLNPEDMWPAYRQFRESTVPQPASPKSGAGATFAKRAALGALPAAGGFAGAELAAGAAAPLALSAAAINPLLGVGVEGLAALAGAIPAGWLAGKAQQAAIDALPETAKRLKIDPETLLAEEKAHPIAARLGEAAPNLALIRPTLSGTAALLGKGTAEEVAAARKAAFTGAGMGAAGDIVQQGVTGQPIDWTDVAEQALLGGLSNTPTTLGRAVGNAARRTIGAEPMYDPRAHQFVPEEPTGESTAQEPTPPPPPSTTKEESLFRDMVMDVLKKSPTIKQFRDATGLDHKTAKAEMERLVNEGYLTYDDKSGRYSVVPENAQYSFVNEGERPRAALNEVPSEQAAPAEAPYVSKRQMELFGTTPEQPSLYVDETGTASTVLPDRNEIDVARKAAVQQQLSALPEGSQFDIFGGTSRAPEPEAPPPEATPEVSDQQRDLFGATLHVDPQGRVYTGTTPENLAPPYLNDPQAEFFRQEALKKQKAAQDFIAAKQKAKDDAKAAREAKKKKAAPPAEPEVITPAAVTAPAAEGETFDSETYNKAFEAIMAQGKATVPVIQKATGATRTKALQFMGDLRNRGITDKGNNVIGKEAAPTVKPVKLKAPEPVKPTSVADRYLELMDRLEEGYFNRTGLITDKTYDKIGEMTNGFKFTKNDDPKILDQIEKMLPSREKIASTPPVKQLSDMMEQIRAEIGGKGEALPEKQRAVEEKSPQMELDMPAGRMRGYVHPEAEPPLAEPNYGSAPYQRSLFEPQFQQGEPYSREKTKEWLEAQSKKSPEELREEAARSGVLNLVGPKERLRAIQKLFGRRPHPDTEAAPSPQERAGKFRDAAIEAYENGKISFKTYEEIKDELKKRTPDLARVEKLLQNKAAERIAERETKRTEEKIRKKEQKKTLDELEAEADRLLAEHGVDLNFNPDEPNELLFQRGTTKKGAIAHEDAVAAAKEATKGWKNAPDVNVVRSREDLPAHLQDKVPDNTPGFYDRATKTVHVISENAPSLEGVIATVFHESLGHYGLEKKFRGDLDSVLNKMYENPSMRKAADEWLKNNPDTYKHLNTDLQKARAVEEVLAERSEGGPTTESGLRGVFNRVAAWVRDWIRSAKQFFGSDLKYSDNDITQILRQAHEGVQGSATLTIDTVFDPVSRTKLNPEAQREADLRFMRSYVSEDDTKPSATREMMERGREVLSTASPALRRGLLSGMSVNQIANEYEKVVPSLRTRHDVLNKKGAALRKDQKAIADNVIAAHEVFKKYSLAQKQKMFDIMNRTTVDQTEVLDDAKRGWVADKTSPLYKEFKALPENVQDVYRKMRETYHEQSNATLQFLSTIMTPSQYQRLVMNWKSNRLRVYLPLFRSGDHWVSYTDKSGEFVKRSFETPRERELAIAQAKQEGAKDIERYNNLQHMIKGAPPAGFFGEVVTALRKAKVSDSVIENVVDSYLKLLPAKSTLQMTRTRKNTAGYEQDVVKSYANVATAQAYHINNMKYNHELEGVMGNIRKELMDAANLHETNSDNPKGLDVDVASALMDNVEQSHQGMLKPNSNSVLSGVQYFNYLQYLAGNVSTAFVALSHLPTVVYPVLGRIRGFDAAAKAMWNAGKYSTNYHFNEGKNIPPEIANVIKRGIDDGVLGERRAEDIAEFKTSGTTRYVGIKARADAIFNKMLGTADKANRDTTLLAAYELHKDALSGKLSGEALQEEAYKRAKQEVYNTLGSAYSSAGANMMQHPIAKLFLTFKQFALNREYMLYKSFKDLTKGESPEVRKAALMQTLGFFAMGGLFAGVQGMPLVGWGELFAKLANDVAGGDDTFDPEEMVKQSVGTLAYKGPINYFLNLNVADRTGWDNMIWRDDEKRRNDVGFLGFAAEKALGPTYSFVTQNAPNAWHHFSEGHFERGLEDVIPKFASNAMKGVRLGLEGATNKDGIPLKHDVNGYNAFMQILGFAPDDLAEMQRENMNRTGMEKKIENSRKTLLTRAALARMTGDDEGFDETLERIEEFNSRHPGAAISGANLSSNILNHYKRLAESVNGISLRPKLRSEIMSAYPDEEE